MARFDVMAGQAWVEIDTPKVSERFLSVPITVEHALSDKRSEFRLDIEAKSWESLIGNSRVEIILATGTRRHAKEAKFLRYTGLFEDIESARERRKADDIEVSIEVGGYYYQWHGSAGQVAPLELRDLAAKPKTSPGIGTPPVPIAHTFSISFSQWKDALGLKKHKPMLISERTHETLEAIRQKFGLWTQEDVIEKFLELYEGKSLEIRQQLLVTLFEDKSIRDRIAELASSAKIREIAVLSPYLGPAGGGYLSRAFKNGAKIRIVTRKETKKDHQDTITQLSGIAEIKYNSMLHARMCIFDDTAALISSADLDSNGLDNQRQAGIYTTDKSVVRDVLTFFEKVWVESEPLE